MDFQKEITPKIFIRVRFERHFLFLDLSSAVVIATFSVSDPKLTEIKFWTLTSVLDPWSRYSIRCKIDFGVLMRFVNCAPIRKIRTMLTATRPRLIADL